MVLEGGIRVPAIVRWPNGLPAGKTSNEFFHFSDWLPTLASMAGLEVPQSLDIDGQDASALLQGEKGKINPVRFWQWNRYDPVPNCNAAMRNGPWKLYQPGVPEAMHKIDSDNQLSEFIINYPEKATENDILCGSVERELSEPPKPSLFNLDEDPYEKNDLSALHPQQLETMKKQLDGWFEKVLRDRASINN
jgi:arylsulfatase A-like enzyme